MQQIADWLKKLGMSEYAEHFAENHIDEGIIRELTETIGAAILLGLKRSTPLWNDQTAVGVNFGPGRFAYFRRRLSHPIESKGGPGALLETLEDCAKFMGHMHRWRQARPHWDRAAELIFKAARTGGRTDGRCGGGADGTCATL